MPLEWLAPLAATADLIPDLPEFVIHVKVGGIVGTAAWTLAALKYRKDIGYALRNLTRREEL